MIRTRAFLCLDVSRCNDSYRAIRLNPGELSSPALREKITSKRGENGAKISRSKFGGAAIITVEGGSGSRRGGLRKWQGESDGKRVIEKEGGRERTIEKSEHLRGRMEGKEDSVSARALRWTTVGESSSRFRIFHFGEYVRRSPPRVVHFRQETFYRSGWFLNCARGRPLLRGNSREGRHFSLKNCIARTALHAITRVTNGFAGL